MNLSRPRIHPRSLPSAHRRNFADHSISQKLFEDAKREEQGSKKPSTPPLLREHENWTGDESMQDAVLRMLVDKYKPLRSGHIKSADEKIKQLAPGLNANISPRPWESTSATSYVLKDQPLLPAVEGHRPWHTTFQTPSHVTASIRHGTFTNQPSPRPLPVDEKARRREKEERKRKHVAGRLTDARESTLDYKLGLKSGQRDLGRVVNPLNMKGWTSLVEDRIERAREKGLFNSIKGRGQPLARHVDEKNPFIGREEFLMNRIVQRNGAAPPWVELQTELDSAIRVFRQVLTQSWTQRAIRTLTTENPAALLSRLTLREVVVMRDHDWEGRERAYHETALAEVNSLVRNYNGVAPYSVRRPYYVREAELERVYEECAEDIYRRIMNRFTNPGRGASGYVDEENDVIGGSQMGAASLLPLRLWDMIKTWLNKWMGRTI